jgi:hypothetical protein
MSTVMCSTSRRQPQNAPASSSSDSARHQGGSGASYAGSRPIPRPGSASSTPDSGVAAEAEPGRSRPFTDATRRRRMTLYRWRLDASIVGHRSLRCASDCGVRVHNNRPVDIAA